MAPGTFTDHLVAAERARNARLRRLWQMSAEQRIAAMRRGELTREQLAAWSARHPEQVPERSGSPPRCRRRVKGTTEDGQSRT